MQLNWKVINQISMMKQAIIALVAISMVTFSFELVVGGSLRPSANTQISDLKKELNDTVAILKLLNESHSTEKTKYERRISVLESSATALRKELDDVHQHNNQNTNELIERIQELSAMVDYLSVQILPYDFIRNLEGEKFGPALAALNALSKNEILVATLINNVHGSDMDKKIPLLRRFCRSISSPELKLLVYKSLANVIKIPNTVTAKSITDVVDLYNSMKLDFPDTVNEAREVKNKLLEIIKQMTATLLKSAMLDQTFSSNRNVTIVSELMYTINSDVFFDVITDVVDSMYSNIDRKRMLEYIGSYSTIRYQMDGYAAAFYKMNRADADSDTWVDLSFRIREINQKQNYNDVPLETKNRFEALADAMPSSLSALAFATSVCLKNVRYQQYLCAPNEKADNDRRHVFTSDTNTHGRWLISRYTSKEISIQNVDSKEYLFYSSMYESQSYLNRFLTGNYAINMRTVVPKGYKMFTWTPKGNIIQNKWKFIYSKARDSVQIMNMNDRELSLVADNYLYNNVRGSNDNRRYADASPEYYWKEDNNLWKIVNCDYKALYNFLLWMMGGPAYANILKKRL